MEENQVQQEKIFLKDNNVTVTQSRYIANSKTYTMRNISSVSLFTLKSSYTLEIILIILGVIILIAGTIIIGGILVSIGILLMVLKKDEHAVRISTNSGEANSLTSKDKDYIKKIVNALNDAIVYRG
jgi:Zn-dependent membrane protease YugP